MKTPKMIIVFSLLLAVLITMAGCGQQAVSDKKTIGVAIYKYDDTFMTSVRNNIEKANAGQADLKMVDSQNSQPMQNDQVSQFITGKVAAMAINQVDRTAAGTIIERAKKANIPVVFFNRAPLAEDMAKWDKVYYIGTKPEEAGTLEAQIVIDYFKTHPEAYRSKDNVMHIALLRGEPGHQDAELRTKANQAALTAAGIKFEIIDSDTAHWNRQEAQDKMAAFLAKDGDKIDVVIANNDDMALGAIEALKAKGFFKDGKYIPVVGIDATAPALKAVEDGLMLGTVLNDAVNQGAATIKFAIVLANGQTPSKDNTGYSIVDGKYVLIPYARITKENIKDAQ